MSSTLSTLVARPTDAALVVGDTRLGVLRFSGTWSINGIPTATVKLPVGTRHGTQEAAAAHATIASLSEGQPARVELAMGGQFSPDTAWPANALTVFEGYVRGWQVRRERGRINLTVNLEHWLADLTYSSMFTELLHPASVGQLGYPSLNQSTGLSAAGSMLLASSAGTAMMASLSDAGTSGDLWAAVKSFLAAVVAGPPGSNLNAEALRDFLAQAGQQPQPGEAAPNAQALAALARIEGPGTPDTVSMPYDYGRPLTLLTPDLEVAFALTRGLAGAPLSTYSGLTPWSYLLRVANPALGAAVYPASDRALFAAHLPTRRGDPWKTVPASEVQVVTHSAPAARPLRGVGLYVDYTGSTADFAATSGALSYGGLYLPPGDPNPRGTFLVVPPPMWLTGLPAIDAGATYNYAADTAVVEAANPGDGGAAPSAGEEARAGRAVQLTEMAAQYCKTIYDTHQQAGSSLMFAGKLRFDIAPGSHLLVQPSGDRGDGGLATAQYGQVNRVTCTVDTDASTAVTTIMMTHVRPETTDTDDAGDLQHGLLGDAPPAGLPLLKEANFD